jgi:hypothetical protein
VYAMKKLKKSEMLRRGQVNIYLACLMIYMTKVYYPCLLQVGITIFSRLSMLKLKGICSLRLTAIALSNCTVLFKMMGFSTLSWNIYLVEI